MLKIDRGESNNVLKLAGRFDGIGAAAFDQFIRSYGHGSPLLVLDLGEVQYMSSAGIGSLVQLERTLTRNEARLALADLQPFVQQTLAGSGLLPHFAIYPSSAKALEDLSPDSSVFSVAWTCTVKGGRTYRAALMKTSGARMEIWDKELALAGPVINAAGLINVILSEMPLAFGLGGLGNSREQASEAFGQFVSLGNTVITVPADGQCYPDFIQTDAPQGVSFCIGAAVAIHGDPAMSVFPVSSPISIAELAVDVPELLSSAAGTGGPTAAFLLYGQAAELRGSVYTEAAEIVEHRQNLEAGTGGDDLVIIAVVTADNANSLMKLREKEWSSIDGNSRMLAYGVRLSGHVEIPAGCSLNDLLKQAVNPERLRGILRIHPETRFAKSRMWIFAAQSVVSGIQSRMKIEVSGEMPFPDEWEVITRRIYSDCSRVALSPMSGGYSATTYRADSYDRDGRRMIPTVLKISSLDRTEREEQAYKQYVAKFILNNSTVIMGHAACGRWAGLRYNFVGILGPGSSLSWLADHYARRPATELTQLLEEVFGRILWPWYGQPKREMLFPYPQHDPSGLFPDIAGEAERILGVSPENRTIACPELRIDLPNPYNFLKYEFPRRKGQGAFWNTSITHGDLNLNNILLDEKENIYVIDFSETRSRNVVSDFARLEPLLSIQMTRLDRPGDMACLLEFIAGLLEISPLKGDPPLHYRGTDPIIEKVWHSIRVLRSFARRVTDGEDQPAFYWIPLLQWTLPIVCFKQLELDRKRLSMYAAGLICKELLK